MTQGRVKSQVDVLKVRTLAVISDLCWQTLSQDVELSIPGSRQIPTDLFLAECKKGQRDTRSTIPPNRISLSFVDQEFNAGSPSKDVVNTSTCTLPAKGLLSINV